MTDLIQLPLRYLHGDKDQVSSLSQIQSERGDVALVVDFWHTKCVKCPAALSKLNDEAGDADASNVLYIGIALSQGPDNYEVAADVSEG
jgi:thiol-disulfide isomerase/thioredoxin